MFGTILLAAVTVLHLYVFARAVSVPALATQERRRVFLGVGVGLWALFAAGRWLGHGGQGPAAAVLELVGMTWMVMLFLTAVALLAVDLSTGFGLLFSRWAQRLRGWALGVGAALTVLALVQGLRPPVVWEQEVRLAGLPEALAGTRVVALADLHLGATLGSDWFAERLTQVAALRPDLVVLLGDVFEGHGEPAAALLEPLRRLTVPMGVWAVAGNHEFHGGAAGSSAIEAAGVRVLRDTWAELRPGLVLAGVEDLTVARRNGGGATRVDVALAGRPPGATVLLSHTPWEVDRAAAAGVGLMLSGHTHGGQIWPFGYLVRTRYPFLAGRYDVGGLALLVSRGTGTWGPRMRLWHPAEILAVTLRSETAPAERLTQ